MKANTRIASNSLSGRISAGLLAVFAILGIVVFSVFSYFGIQNGAVEKDESVKAAWSDVESSYQRRADLIPNLVSTVKGAADFEKEVLTTVTEARASVGQIKVSGDALLNDPAAMQDFAARQQTLGTALSRLMVVAEKYPTLTATQNFADLQNQLEGTENRIAQDRRKFNDAVKEYNSFTRKVPNKWLLDESEYPLREGFKAAEGSDAVPAVDFGN